MLDEKRVEFSFAIEDSLFCREEHVKPIDKSPCVPYT